MPRKLEAGFAGRYLMSRVLMTSTMKSEPGAPPIRDADNSFGVPLSAAATCTEGGSAEGRRGGALAVVAARAAGGPIAVAAPATATPVRNLRRLTSARGRFRAMQFPPYLLSCAAIGGRRRLNRAPHGVILSARRYAGKSVGPLAVNIHPSRVVPASRKPALHRTLVCLKNYRTHGSEETIAPRNF